MSTPGLRLSVAAAQLAETFGDNPQDVGREDGTEDDWGDLVWEASVLLGHNWDEMKGDEWEHFQDVAAECRATNMAAWLAHLQAVTC